MNLVLNFETNNKKIKEVLNFETKKINADRKKIAPLVPGMPLRMGFVYKNVLRPQIMQL